MNQESPTRARTRAAILDAALQILPTDPSASLAQIATAAGVGRSTLHRYYPDRDSLLFDAAREVGRRALHAIRAAQEQATDFLTVLTRATDMLLELGPMTSFITSNPVIGANEELVQELYEVEQQGFEELFATSDAKLKAPMTPQWAGSFYNSLLYAGDEALMHNRATRAEVIDFIMAAMTNGIVEGK